MVDHDTYDEKLEHILRKAATVFAQKGYHRASIREIARATRVSLSGLYYYFSGKEELLFLIQDHCLGTLLEQLEGQLDGVDDPLVRLEILVRNHLRFFVANMSEMKVLAHEARSLSGEYRERVFEKERAYVHIAFDILDDLSPGEDAADQRVAVYTLFGMMNWIYNWYRPERDPDVGRLADEMLHIFVRGYLSAPVEIREAGSRPEGKLGSLWDR